MTREIKFRAWDKRDKVMREVYGIQFSKISNKGNRDSTTIEMHCSDYEGSKAISLSDFSDNIERVELMQYTGLKDKNGKEIYEGDIVKIKDGQCGEENVNVYWSGETGDIQAVYAGSWCVFMCNHEEDMLSTYEDVEIIGNIYENPELIKK